MNQLMLENCVHLWDPNNVYKNEGLMMNLQGRNM